MKTILYGHFFVVRVIKDLVLQAVISLSEEVQVLKEEVRNTFASTTSNPKTKLELIEAIQRLGIAYHFESEIEESLENIFKNKQDFDNENDLYTVALLLRLFRQQGYNVSSSKLIIYCLIYSSCSILNEI